MACAQQMDQAELAEHLIRTQDSARRLVAIAGCPGSGKSTLAEKLCGDVNSRFPGLCAVLPMDGYHFDDMVLEARGHRPRKGAPFTFDTGGLRTMLHRLKAEADSTIAVPVFDRSIEIARAGARLIEPEVKLVLVEGNYLLLEEPGWRPISGMFDMTVFLDVPRRVLQARLRRRWVDMGFDAAALEAQLAGNDFLNIEIVLAKSGAADICVRTFEAGER